MIFAGDEQGSSNVVDVGEQEDDRGWDQAQERTGGSLLVWRTSKSEEYLVAFKKYPKKA